MTKKNSIEEFRRDAVWRYRGDTDGTTVAAIAADLGIPHGSLITWPRNAGIPIRRHGTSSAPRPDPDETPEQEASYAPRSLTYTRRKPSSRPSETSCGRRPNISPERRIGEPFPLRCSPLRHLPGESVMQGRRHRSLVVLRMDQRPACGLPAPLPTSNSPSRSTLSTK